jgi:hypothetical protein
LILLITYYWIFFNSTIGIWVGKTIQSLKTK